MVCGRTFWSFESPLPFRPFPVSPTFSDHRRTANLDVGPFPAPTRGSFEGIHSSQSVFGDYVISEKCMQITKRRLAAKPKFSKVVRFAVRRKRPVLSVDRSMLLSVCGRFQCWRSSPRALGEFQRRPCRAEDVVAVGFAKNRPMELQLLRKPGMETTDRHDALTRSTTGAAGNN
jgi:hypothetical protein